MRPEDFADKAPGQVIQSQWQGKAYWAFLPAPLSPDLEIDWALAALIAEATGALSRLQGAGARMRNPDLLIAPFLQREAVLSSRIEEIGQAWRTSTRLRQTQKCCLMMGVLSARTSAK